MPTSPPRPASCSSALLTTLALLAALMLLVTSPHGTHAQFSFSLPGKWGSGRKRSSLPPLYSLPWADSAGSGGPGAGMPLDCSEFDPDVIYRLYKALQNEALRINECMLKLSEDRPKQ